MVASAHAAHLTRRAVDYGVQTGPVSVNLDVVRRRKRDIVARWRSGSEGHLAQDGVDVIMSTAQFTGPQTVVVDVRTDQILDGAQSGRAAAHHNAADRM